MYYQSPRKKNRSNGTEELFKEIMARNIPTYMKKYEYTASRTA